MALLLASLIFTSCTEKFTVEEIRSALPKLVEASARLNKIYFGEGFDIDGTVSDVNKNGGYFYCDTEEMGLHSILDIKDETEKVFTKEYASILYMAAFEGTSSDISVEGARFIEGEKGLMQKADSDVYEIADRVFDYKSIEIIKIRKNSVIFKINSIANGKNETLEMVLVRYTTEGGESYYRLDSPTY